MAGPGLCESTGGLRYRHRTHSMSVTSDIPSLLYCPQGNFYKFEIRIIVTLLPSTFENSMVNE